MYDTIIENMVPDDTYGVIITFKSGYQRQCYFSGATGPEEAMSKMESLIKTADEKGYFKFRTKEGSIVSMNANDITSLVATAKKDWAYCEDYMDPRFL